MAQLNLSETECGRRLTPERAFAGTLTDNKADGVYACAAGKLDLFDRADKFDCESGRPSFSRPIAADRVTDHSDISHGMMRTATRCARCDGHQGRVFPDGAPPTRLRYGINSVALDFRSRR